MSNEAWDVVKRDHRYLGKAFEINGQKVDVSDDFANSNRIQRKHTEMALRQLNSIRPFVFLRGRNTLTIDIGEVVGQVRCMQTYRNDLDNIFYAPRRKRFRPIALIVCAESHV